MKPRKCDSLFRKQSNLKYRLQLLIQEIENVKKCIKMREDYFNIIDKCESLTLECVQIGEQV